MSEFTSKVLSQELNTSMKRRHFLGGLLTAAVSTSLVRPALAQTTVSTEPGQARSSRKIRLGVIGCGGRGAWIAGLFAKHGGYEMHAVADYFQHVADACGDALGVDKARRFSGLSCYQKLIASGVEAVACETPPYFIPQHARAAVEAGLHVYMAKPVAADVPGCMQVQAAGALATGKKRCFLVDYQMPTDPGNIEVRQRILDGAIGPLAQILTHGTGGGCPDPPKTGNLEDRLQKLTWVNDIAMGCDYLGNFDIHAIDAALWVTGKRPVAASGASRICRKDPHGDSHDVCSVVYEYEDGLVHNHFGQALPNGIDGELSCRVFGQSAHAVINYWGKACLKGGDKAYDGGEVVNLYQSGAERNIAAFHANITEGRFDNPTFQRAVDGALTCILGREAASRHARLTMDELVRENRRLDVDLTGLKG